MEGPAKLSFVEYANGVTGKIPGKTTENMLNVLEAALTSEDLTVGLHERSARALLNVVFGGGRKTSARAQDMLARALTARKSPYNAKEHAGKALGEAGVKAGALRARRARKALKDAFNNPRSSPDTTDFAGAGLERIMIEAALGRAEKARKVFARALASKTANKTRRTVSGFALEKLISQSPKKRGILARRQYNELAATLKNPKAIRSRKHDAASILGGVLANATAENEHRALSARRDLLNAFNDASTPAKTREYIIGGFLRTARANPNRLADEETIKLIGDTLNNGTEKTDTRLLAAEALKEFIFNPHQGMQPNEIKPPMVDAVLALREALQDPEYWVQEKAQTCLTTVAAVASIINEELGE